MPKHLASLGVGSGAFSPASISGLALWFAAHLETGFNDDDAVATWTDRSGNGRNATQATGTKRPLYKTNIISGKPVLRFDNTDDCLTTAAIDFSGTAGLTLFVVTVNITSATDRIIFETSATAATNAGAIQLFRATANTVSASHRGGSSSSFTTTGTVTSAATVMSSIFDRSLATNEVTIWLNGSTAGTRVNNNQAGNHGNHAANIGSRNNGASLPLGGDIAEIILYDTALSSDNRLLVERYLGAKYGITVA